MFRSSHFSFLVSWSFLATKLQKYYVIFVYILQGKMGKTKKNRKTNYATKVTKIPKTKKRKCGKNKTKLFQYFSLFVMRTISGAQTMAHMIHRHQMNFGQHVRLNKGVSLFSPVWNRG